MMMTKVVLGIGLLLAVCMSVLSPVPAFAVSADRHQQHVISATEGPLSLEITPSQLSFTGLTPGDAVTWSITPMLAEGLSGPLSVRVLSQGALAEDDAGARLLLRTCGEPWAGEGCGSEESVVVDAPLNRLDPGAVHQAGFLSSTDVPYFHATMSMPEDLPDRLQNTGATFALGFTALGDEEVVVSGPPRGPDVPGGLPVTGLYDTLIIVCAGLLMAAAGLILRLSARTRRTA